MTARRPALAPCCLLVVAGLLALLILRPERHEPPPAPVAEPRVAPTVAAVGGATQPRAVRVLRGWDARRAAAWASGDPAALVPLYVPRSAAGRADRAMLREYAERGLRVTGLRMQMLAVEVLADRRRTLRLLVTDRLAYAVARGRGRSVVLPRDQPSTRRITLRRTGRAWRVADVAAQPSAVASTASMSRSRKE